MENQKTHIIELIKELEAIKEREDFEEYVFNLDGSPNSKYLQLYSSVVQKYFDTKDTEDLKDFKLIKEKAFEFLKTEKLDKEAYYSYKNKFSELDIEPEERFKIKTLIMPSRKLTFRNYKTQYMFLINLIKDYDKKIKRIIQNLFKYNHCISLEEYNEKLKEYNDIYKDTEEKLILDILLFKEEDEEKTEEFLLEQLEQITMDYEEEDKSLVFEIFKFNKLNILNKTYRKDLEVYQEEYRTHKDKNIVDKIIFSEYKTLFKDYLNNEIALSSLMEEKTMEEKTICFQIFYSNNAITKIEKDILELEIKYILLAEYIFANKFKKLLKKEIHKKVKSRYISSSVIGTIASSNAETNALAKYNKDDLLTLIKDEALSYAMEGFLIGMRRYDITKGNYLSTYMVLWLKQKVTYYLEKDSSLNKATKSIDNLKNYKFEDSDEEDFKFHKFDNIKYTNIHFQNIEDMSNSLSEKNEFSEMEAQQTLVYDILIFFGKYKHIFLYHEYLLIKYDLLLENYIYFIDINPKQEIIDSFYEDINIFIKKINKREEFKDVKGFTNITEFYKIPEMLEAYFDVEHSEFLSIKRALKQKFINMLNKIFTKTD